MHLPEDLVAGARSHLNLLFAAPRLGALFPKPSGSLPRHPVLNVSKTVVGATPPRVRIPVSPPSSTIKHFILLYSFNLLRRLSHETFPARECTASDFRGFPHSGKAGALHFLLQEITQAPHAAGARWFPWGLPGCPLVRARGRGSATRPRPASGPRPPFAGSSAIVSAKKLSVDRASMLSDTRTSNGKSFRFSVTIVKACVFRAAATTCASP